MTSQVNECPHFFVFFSMSSFLRLILAYRLCVIYVREYSYFNIYIQVMNTGLLWTKWTSLYAVQERLLNLITHLSNFVLGIA